MLNELGIPHQNFTKKDMVVALKIAIQRGGFAAYRTAEYVSFPAVVKIACMRAKLNYESGSTAMIKANKY